MKRGIVRGRQKARRLACQAIYGLSFYSGVDDADMLENAFVFAMTEPEAQGVTEEEIFSEVMSGEAEDGFPGRNGQDARQEEAAPVAMEPADRPDEEFARTLARGVCAKSGELDGLIGSYSKKWRQERIGKMEMALLRLAIYEILYCGTPPRIVISETLDMADQFGAGRAKYFLNGILHAVYRNRQGKADIGVKDWHIGNGCGEQ